MVSQHSSPTDLFTLIENMRNMITTHVPDTIPNQHSSYKSKSTTRIAMLICLENIENIAREISAPGDMKSNNDDTQTTSPSNPALPSSPSSSPIENTYHPALIPRNIEDDAVMNGYGVDKDGELGKWWEGDGVSVHEQSIPIQSIASGEDDASRSVRESESEVGSVASSLLVPGERKGGLDQFDTASGIRLSASGSTSVPSTRYPYDSTSNMSDSQTLRLDENHGPCCPSLSESQFLQRIRDLAGECDNKQVQIDDLEDRIDGLMNDVSEYMRKAREEKVEQEVKEKYVRNCASECQTFCRVLADMADAIDARLSKVEGYFCNRTPSSSLSHDDNTTSPASSPSNSQRPHFDFPVWMRGGSHTPLSGPISPKSERENCSPPPPNPSSTLATAFFFFPNLATTVLLSDPLAWFQWPRGSTLADIRSILSEWSWSEENTAHDDDELALLQISKVLNIRRDLGIPDPDIGDGGRVLVGLPGSELDGLDDDSDRKWSERMNRFCSALSKGRGVPDGDFDNMSAADSENDDESEERFVNIRDLVNLVEDSGSDAETNTTPLDSTCHIAIPTKPRCLTPPPECVPDMFPAPRPISPSSTDNGRDRDVYGVESPTHGCLSCFPSEISRPPTRRSQYQTLDSNSDIDSLGSTESLRNPYEISLRDVDGPSDPLTFCLPNWGGLSGLNRCLENRWHKQRESDLSPFTGSATPSPTLEFGTLPILSYGDDEMDSSTECLHGSPNSTFSMFDEEFVTNASKSLRKCSSVSSICEAVTTPIAFHDPPEDLKKEANDEPEFKGRKGKQPVASPQEEINPSWADFVPTSPVKEEYDGMIWSDCMPTFKQGGRYAVNGGKGREVGTVKGSLWIS